MTEEPREAVIGEKATEPSVSELLGALARNTGSLVRQEVQLATAETTAKVKTAALQIGLISAGGALAHVGLLTLIAGTVLALSGIIPMWICALVMGAAAMATGYVLVQHGLTALRKLDPVPIQTVKTLKEDGAWAKEQLHGSR
jgi:hypothetical protein